MRTTFLGHPVARGGRIIFPVTGAGETYLLPPIPGPSLPIHYTQKNRSNLPLEIQTHWKFKPTGQSNLQKNQTFWRIKPCRIKPFKESSPLEIQTL